MAAPAWLVKSLTLVGESPSEIEWHKGRALSIKRKYFIEVEIPVSENTEAKKRAWFLTNIEGADLSPSGLANSSSPFYGAPIPNSEYSTGRGLYAYTYSISFQGYLSKIVYLTVTYARADIVEVTDNGQVVVPFGGWGISVSWTNSKLSGVDYLGSPLMTLAGEVINAQVNVPVYTFTRSLKVAYSTVAAPTINSVAHSYTGFVMHKHCGLRVQTNVPNTGTDALLYPYILTEQVMYIPRMVSIADGTIVNAVEGGIETLADVGSFDVLMLHQGHRQIKDGAIVNVTYWDNISGREMTLNALSVLDDEGLAVVPDPVTGLVTPYYLAFQMYPESDWTL